VKPNIIALPAEWAALATLDIDRPRGDVPPWRWERFISDCGLIVQDGWAQRARTLGWPMIALVGCNKIRPFARIDHAGALWLLNGSELIDLSDHSAVVLSRTGQRLRCGRQTAAAGERCLPWELPT
jgi:hypothetical protein